MQRAEAFLAFESMPHMLQTWHLCVFSLSAGGSATEKLWLSLSQGWLIEDKQEENLWYLPEMVKSREKQCQDSAVLGLFGVVLCL